MRTGKKSAPASAATLTGAVENGTACKTAHASTKNDTTDGAGRQLFRVSDLLLHGQGNALPMRHLKELTGPDSRVIRRQIETERRQGRPILSDNQHGYWLSDSPAEIKRFSRSMRRRAAEIRLTAMCVEKSAEV